MTDPTQYSGKKWGRGGVWKSLCSGGLHAATVTEAGLSFLELGIWQVNCPKTRVSGDSEYADDGPCTVTRPGQDQRGGDPVAVLGAGETPQQLLFWPPGAIPHVHISTQSAHSQSHITKGNWE